MSIESIKKFRSEFVDKISTLSVAAFGLVAALAWNEAIQGVFKTYYGEAGNNIAKIVYAIIVTSIAVLVTIWISNLASKLNGKK